MQHFHIITRMNTLPCDYNFSNDVCLFFDRWWWIQPKSTVSYSYGTLVSWLSDHSTPINTIFFKLDEDRLDSKGII
jgi:hypothetical protein